MAVADLIVALGERGTLLDPEAAAWLEEDADACGRAEGSLLKTDDLPMVVTRDDVERLLGGGAPSAEPAPTPAPQPASRDPRPAYGDAPRAAAAAPELAAKDDPALAEALAATTPERAPAAGPAPEDEADPAVAPVPAALNAPPSIAVTPDAEALVDAKVATFDHRYEILLDITGNSSCEGDIQDFVKYFKDRLNKGRKLLKQRRDMVGAIPIERVRPGAYAEVRIVGMVTEVRPTKNGHRLIELEDESGTAVILAPKNEPQLVAEADTVIEDEVIGVVAKPARNGDLLILQQVIRPDVPMERDRRVADRPSLVAFLSDVHIGSKTFLQEDWERFVRFITLEDPDGGRRALAKQTKYLVVNGDVVDGVGMFPGQEDELSIVDAYGQYAAAGDAFHRIQAARPDLKIFMLPGNHDLVRPAEPQPAFPEKYSRLFPQDIVFMGNPGKLLLEGVEVLAYHGRSFDDWITRVQGLSYERPIEVMKQMVQRRHLVPIYGLRTPLAPEHKDYLVVDTVPDVFVTGHVHSAGLDTYRGMTLINSSCWQSQTAYQKMHGFKPVPGIVPLVDLRTGNATMMDFHKGPAGVDAVGKSNLARKPDPRVPAGDVV